MIKMFQVGNIKCTISFYRHTAYSQFVFDIAGQPDVFKTVGQPYR